MLHPFSSSSSHTQPPPVHRKIVRLCGHGSSRLCFVDDSTFTGECDAMDVEQEESIEPQPPPSPVVGSNSSSSSSFQFRPEEIQSSAPDTVSVSTLKTLASTSSTSLPPPPPPPRELQSLDSVASTSTTCSSPPSSSPPHGANPVSTEPSAIATEPPVSASTSSQILSSNNKSRSSCTVSTVYGSVEPNSKSPLLPNKEGCEVRKTSSNVSVLTGLSSGSFSKFERMSSGAQSSSLLSPAHSLDPPPAGSCDVFIGFHGTDSSLIRYTKWMRAELELHGITCFSADRASYAYAADHHHHRHQQQQQQQHTSNSDVALKSTMSSASFGVILISRNSFKNPYTIEELTHFLAHRNLVPVFFDVAASDCLVRDIIEKQGEVWEVEGGELWKEYSGDETIWREAVTGMVMVEDLRVEACEGNWRESIQTVVGLLRLRIHQDHMIMNPTSQPPVDVTPPPASASSASDEVDEFPCPRNLTFVGREKELKTLEKLLILSEGFTTTTGADVAQSLARTSQDARSSAHFSDVEDSLDWKLPLSGSLVPHSGGLESHGGYSPGASHGWQHETRRRSHSEIHELEKDMYTTRREREARGWPLKRERPSGSYIRQGWKAGHYVEVPSSRKRACVTGISGIGKSELALEFAYRHIQKYRRVLWVGGEDRYLRQNYLDLSSALGIELVGNESKQLGSVRVRAFDDQVTAAIQRIRRELEKDLPYLLVIDNLENERDWWDGRELSDLLPRPGIGATDILITTRLPAGVTHIDSFELSFLSTFEALTLMRGGKERSFSVRQLDKFKEFEDKLQRLPLGLAIVGRLISDFGVKPTEILGRMGRVDHHNNQPANTDSDVLQSNPFLEKLLDVCFKLMGEASGPRHLATRMAWVGGWFGPVPCPIPLLGFAAEKLLKELGGLKMWSECLTSTFSCWVSPQSSRLEAEAAALLIRFGIAQPNVRQQSLKFHEIIQLYCRRRGGEQAARSFVRAVRKGANVVTHFNLFWGAAFLVCRFATYPAVVEFRVSELLVLSRKLVVPLALRSFNTFSRCVAALEILRMCYVMLEDVEKSFVSQVQNRWNQSLCWRRVNSVPNQVDEYVWQDLTLVKAHLLEIRAKLMMRGGQFDAGEELLRTCINIRTVMLGPDNPDTLAAEETLSKLVRTRDGTV